MPVLSGLVSIPREMWNIATHAKRGEIVETIAGLPIGRVPRGLSSCFWELLSSPNVDSIEWLDRTDAALGGGSLDPTSN